MGCCNELATNDIGRKVFHIKINKDVAITQEELNKIKKDFVKAFKATEINAEVVLTGDYVSVERVL